MKARSQSVDIFRGIVIVDMMLMHFAGDQEILGLPVQMVDFAVEGFLFLAGFTIGWHYLQKFQRDRRAVAIALWVRAGKLALIHYVMILTISLPFWSYFQFQTTDQAIEFARSSFLFLNQVPILHILPTFIPLFLLSPVLLYFMSRDWDWCLPIASLALFGVFVSNPNALTIGENRIFPVILWQVYFVFGCVLGKRMREEETVVSNGLLFLAVFLFSLCLIVKYGGHFSTIRDWKQTYNLYPKKFPLNPLGLAYGSALLASVFAIFRLVSNRVGIGNPAFGIFSLIGRQSLLVFFLHAYAVFEVRALTMLGASSLFVFATLALSFWGIVGLTKVVDRKATEDALPKPYKWLFS